jgi:hypothetical protein
VCGQVGLARAVADAVRSGRRLSAIDEERASGGRGDGY